MADQRTSPNAAGRDAERPQDVPPRGWKRIALGAWAAQGRDNIALVAGGVTYYVLLALFPALAALVSIYGLVSSPAQVKQQVASLSGLLPGGAQQVIGGELDQLTSTSHGALGFGAVLGLVFALWTASRGMSGMMTALDIAYGREERRGFVRRNLVAIGLTLALIVVGVVAIALVAGAPAVFAALGLGGVVKWAVLILEWPLLMVILVTLLALLYRYAPDREQPKWVWVTPGAVAATLLWVVGSIAFTVYVANFGSYNKTYGSLGALIGMLTWMYLSAYVVLLGAEINSQAERRTDRDTRAA